MEGIANLGSMIEANWKYVEKLPAAAVTLVIAYVVITLTKKAILAATGLARINRAVQTMVNSAVNFVGWVLALSAVLNVMELTQLSLALGGSIALIAMALATGLNNVTQDLMAGIFLLGDRDFAKGAWVRAGGVEGELEELTIRKARIRDAEGNLHVVPNRNIDGGTYVIVASQPADEKKGA